MTRNCRPWDLYAKRLRYKQHQFGFNPNRPLKNNSEFVEFCFWNARFTAVAIATAGTNL